MSKKSQQRKKRIVSKSAYATLVAKREAKRWGSIALAILVAVCFICGMGFLYGVVLAEDLLGKALNFAGLVLSFGGGYVLLRAAEKQMQAAQVKLDAVPLTQANIADLPPQESLVRASDAPASPPNELLRAATQGSETPAQELLRAGITGSSPGQDG